MVYDARIKKIGRSRTAKGTHMHTYTHKIYYTEKNKQLERIVSLKQ